MKARTGSGSLDHWGAGIIRPFTFEDRDAVERVNSTHYRTAHGFDVSFDDAVSSALDRIGPSVNAKTGAGWVLEVGGAVAGSLFLTPDNVGAGRVRLFLVRAELQGRGFGAEMMEQCLQAAGPLGFHTIHVSTFSVHEAACALYFKTGFQEVQRAACHMFGQDLVQVDFLRRGDLPFTF